MDPLELAKAMATELDPFGRSRPVTMAVDGPVGSGATLVADRVAEVCRARGRSVLRIHGDDFVHHRSVDDPSGDGHPVDAVGALDDTALRQLVLEPLARGDRTVAARMLNGSAAPVDALTERVPDDGLVIVDGSFLLQSSLRAFWDLRVLLEIGETGQAARVGRRRPAAEEGPRRSREYDRYLQQDDPAGVADIVIDNTSDRRPVPLRWP